MSITGAMSKFYREAEKQLFSIYYSEDLAARSPRFMGIPEPPPEILMRPLSPYGVYIGKTDIGNRPWYWDPSLIQNPLIGIIGMPGTGKSLPPDQELIVWNGKEYRIKRINDVAKGEYVVSVTQSFIDEAYAGFTRVIGVHRMNHNSTVLRVVLSSGREVVATPDHSFLVVEKCRIVPRKGSKLREGDVVPVLSEKQIELILKGDVNPHDNFVPTYERITRIIEEEFEGDVYDIETIENTFMTANGVFVHNSETVKTLIIRLKKKGIDIPVIIVDPEDEYHVIVRQLGEGVVLNVGTEHYINIFDRPSWRFPYQLWVRKAVIPGILKALRVTPRQAPLMMRVLEKAIFDVYEKVYRFHPVDPSTWRKEDPTLLDVVRQLESEVRPYLEGRETRQKPLFRTIMSLLERLRRWVEGMGTDFFAHKSTIRLSELLKQPIVVFNIKKLPPDARDMFTYYIFNYFYALMEMTQPMTQFLRLLLVFDEGWILLKKEQGEETPLALLFRRARKYGFAAIIATQQYKDVSTDILPLVGTVILLRIRDAEAVEKLKKSLQMPDRIAKMIPTLPTGKAVVSIAWVSTEHQNANVPFVVNVETAVKSTIPVVLYKKVGPEEVIRALKTEMSRSGEST